MVCRHWLQVFRSGRQWRRLVIGERSFIRRKFRVPVRRWAEVEGVPSTLSDDDLDPEYEVDHQRLQIYLGKFGGYCQRLSILPLTNYFNLFEFLRVFSRYFAFFDDFPMPNLDRFEFCFAAENRSGTETTIVGTGGQILNELRRTLGNIRCDLRSLTINDLFLDSGDAVGLLDTVINNCGETLRHLELLNMTRVISNLTHLRQLTISHTQMTDEDLLVDIASCCSSLERLTLVEDHMSTAFCRRLDDESQASPRLIRPEAWRQVRHLLPHLRVRLEYRGSLSDFQETSRKMTLPDAEAPVDEIAYVDWPWSNVTDEEVQCVIDRFSKTLTSYGHYGCRWRGKRSRSFEERADGALVTLVRHCRCLRRLVIKERVSTGTLMVLASEGRSHLRELVVRRNAVVLGTDWARNNTWSDDFLNTLRTSSRSYDKTEREISNLLMLDKWRMLLDRHFKHVRV